MSTLWLMQSERVKAKTFLLWPNATVHNRPASPTESAGCQDTPQPAEATGPPPSYTNRSDPATAISSV